MMRFFMLVKLGMPKLRRLSNLILRLIPSIGLFEYLANLGLAAFKTWASFLSVVKVGYLRFELSDYYRYS